MIEKKYEHAGHRKRMKDKYIEYGIEIFSPHEVLEVLLYYAIPRKDTNSTAHKLIDEFGSISAVIDAPYESLVNNEISKDAAVFLNLIPALREIYMSEKFHDRIFAVNYEMTFPKFIELFSDKTEEFVYIILTDSKSNELYSEMIKSCFNFEAEQKIEKICKLAVHYSAKNAIIAYNRPSSPTIPKKDDVLITVELYQSLNRLNVVLEDNFFVSGKKCISFQKSGIFFKNKNEFMKSVFYNNPLLE